MEPGHRQGLRAAARCPALVVLAVLVASGLAVFAGPPEAAARGGVGFAITGRVVGVTDGDTLTILDGSLRQYRVRLGGVDTPERGQPYGKVAKSSLSALAFGHEATADCGKADRWGRLVCKVSVGGRDVGLSQVERGLGWHYKKYEREQSAADRLAYAQAEEDARSARRGLWADPSPVAPWDWRHPKLSRFGGRLPRVDRGRALEDASPR